MSATRRGLLAGLGALIAAPAIIRTPGLLMPIKAIEPVEFCVAVPQDAWRRFHECQIWEALNPPLISEPFTAEELDRVVFGDFSIKRTILRSVA